MLYGPVRSSPHHSRSVQYSNSHCTISKIWTTTVSSQRILESLVRLFRCLITVECQRYCLWTTRHASASRLASQRRVGDTRVVLSTLASNKRRLLVPRSDHRTMRYKADTRPQAQNPLARGTVRGRRSYRLPTGLPLERPDLVPFPSALSLLVFHLPHAMAWMAEDTRPMGADAGVVSLSRMSR
ncbi:hypothetical protein BDP81DRAFT_48363 [Colletotrichum phormii]|uniref:Uncharacterized protein n=1 Tax=Colletotrichum phormii TaxID=359342 RepID=A0AAJ0EFU1_9PEZI|nr:uncharacterized protein BDP81DRAFT_48363 [Colletotrichum phormii]KAK1635305.1 hypothetical protein BDP81DRAFT_48363 [Colletotrichum phormii]